MRPVIFPSLIFVGLSSVSFADTLNLEYQNEPNSATESGSSALVTLSGGTVITNKRAIGESDLFNWRLNNPATPITGFNIDLTNFTAPSSFTIGSIVPEYKANSFNFIEDLDGSTNAAPRFAADYNNVSITGNAAQGSQPRSRFTFTGIEDALNPRSEDKTLSLESLILTNVEYVESDLAGSRSTPSSGSLNCLNPPECYGGDVTLQLGGGASHSRAYLELNNARIGAELKVGYKETSVKVGQGDSYWNGGGVTFTTPDTAGSFTMKGDANQRAILTLAEFAPRNSVLGFDAGATSASYFYLGKSAQLDYAHLRLESTSLAAPSNSVWNANNSTIELKTAVSPTRNSSLRLGALNLNNSQLNVTGDLGWVYIGQPNIATGNADFNLTNSQFSLFSSTSSRASVVADTVFKGSNLVLEGGHSNSIAFKSASNRVQSGTLFIDGASFPDLQVDSGATLATMFGTGSSGLRDISNLVVNGDLVGSGNFTGNSVGVDAQFNGTVDFSRIELVNGSPVQTEAYGEVNMSNVDWTFGSNSKLVFEADAVNTGGVFGFQGDLIQLINSQVKALPNIELNIPNNTAGTVTADDLDGLQVQVLAIYQDSLNLGRTAGLQQDVTQINGTTGPDMPALTSVTFVDDASSHGSTVSVGGVNGDEVANISAVFGKKPVSSLVTNPNIQTANQQQVMQQVVNTVQSSPTSNTTIQNVVISITNSQLGSHATTLSPEPFASHQTVNLEMTDYALNSVFRRTQFESDVRFSEGYRPMLFDESQSERPQGGIWVDTSYIEGDIDNEDQVGGFNYYLSGISFGGEFFSSDSFMLGAYGMISQQTMDEHDNTGLEFDTDGWQSGFYGTWHIDPSEKHGYRVSAVLGGGQFSTDSSRRVVFGSNNETLTADFDTQVYYLGARLFKSIPVNRHILAEPFVGLTYLESNADGFTETSNTTAGQNLAWEVDKSKEKAEIASLGLIFKDNEQSQLFMSPVLLLRYDHDFDAESGEAPKVKARIAGSGGAFSEFESKGRGKDSATIGLGGIAKLNDSMRLGGGVVYTKAVDSEEHGIGLNYEWRW